MDMDLSVNKFEFFLQKVKSKLNRIKKMLNVSNYYLLFSLIKKIKFQTNI